MTTSIETLFIKVDTSEVNRGKDALGNFAKAGQTAETSVLRLGRAVVVMGASFVAFKALQYAQEASTLYARYETLGVVMRTVGNNAGYTGKQMEATALSLQKTGISMVESRQQVVRLVQAHIDLASASKLARIAQDAAVIGNVNSSDAFARLVHGIQSGQTEVLRTIGINVSMENSYKTMAQQLGVTTGQLTQAQKTQAVLNAVMIEGAGIAGTYEAAMGTAGKQLLSMQRYTENLKLQIGETFNEALIIAVMAATDGLKGLNQEAQDLAVTGQFREWGRNAILTFAVVGDAVMVLASLIKELYQEIVFFGKAASLVMKGEFGALGDLTKARASEFRANVDSYGALTRSAQARFDLMDKERANQVTLNDVTGKTQINTVETQVNADAIKKAASARESAISTAQSYILSLQQETEQIGLNNIQRKMMDASYAAAKAPTLALKQEIMASAQAWGQLTQAQEEGALTEKTRIENLAILAREQKKSAEDSAASWRQIGSTIESTGRFAFISFAANGMKAMDSIKASFKMMMAEIAYQLAKRWVLNMVMGGGGVSMSGIASAFGGGGGSAASGGMSLMNIGSGISSMYSALTGGLTSTLGSGIAGLGSMFGSSAVSAFGAGLAGSTAGIFSAAGGAGTAFIGGAGTAIGGAGMGAAASIGASLAALAGPAIALIAVDLIFRKLAGDKVIGGGVGKVLNYVPVLGPMLNTMFGRGPFKPIGPQKLVGQFDTSGFGGDLQQVERSKGGWFRKNRQRTVHTALSSDTQESLSSVVASASAIYADLIQSADEGARSLAGWTYSVKRQIDSEEKIKQLITDVSNSIGTRLVPELAAVQQKGEQLADTAIRMRSEFILTTELIDLTGQSFGALGLASTVARDGLIQLLGGVDKAGPALQSYYQNFYTDAERTATGWRLLNHELSNLGLDVLPTTIEQYRALAESQDLSSTAGQGMFSALVQLAPAFASLAGSASSARDRILALSSAQEAYLAEKLSTSGSLFEYQRAVGSVMSANIDGSHADGLDRVPFSGYVAQLHSGERVKTASASRQEDAVASEIRSMRVELNAALVSIALSTGDTAKRNRKWDGEGLPATRT